MCYHIDTTNKEVVVMQINQNIAHYRKRLGYTQEQLAAQLGVTAQSVSKWENELSSPDISLLPDLAKALGVDVNALFAQAPAPLPKVSLSDVPELCYDALLSIFARAQHTFYYGGKKMLSDESLEKWVRSLKKDLDFPLPKCAYAIDEAEHEHSAFFVSDAISFIDRSYGGMDSTLLFDLDKAGELLSVLGDKNARRILKTLYEKLITEGVEGTSFSPEALSVATSLTVDAISDAAVKLRHVGLMDEVEKIGQNGLKKEYCALYSKDFIFVLAILRLAYIHTSDMTYLTLMYKDAKGCLNYDSEAIKE